MTFLISSRGESAPLKLIPHAADSSGGEGTESCGACEHESTAEINITAKILILNSFPNEMFCCRHDIPDQFDTDTLFSP